MKKHFALWLAIGLCIMAIAVQADGDTRVLTVNQLVCEVPASSLVLDASQMGNAQGVMLADGVILGIWMKDGPISDQSPFMQQVNIYITPSSPLFAIERRQRLTIDGCRAVMLAGRYPERPDELAETYLLPTAYGVYSLIFYVADEKIKTSRTAIDAVVASIRFDRSLAIATAPPVIATPTPTRAFLYSAFLATAAPTQAPMLLRVNGPITLEEGNYAVGVAIEEGVYRLSLPPGERFGGAICQNSDGKWQNKMQSMFDEQAAIEPFEIVNGQLLNIMGKVVLTPIEEAPLNSPAP